MSIRIWILIIVLFLSFFAIVPSPPWDAFEKGVVIKSVEKNSSAFESGLRQGMIIKSVNSREIKNVEDYGEKMSEIFSQQKNETKLVINTKDNEFIFLADSIPQLTISEIPKTKLKTGLDLSGGARALVKPDVEISDSQLQDLVEISANRFNVYGISDVNIKGVSDLEGNKFMLIEIAGATPFDLKELIEKQGKFEAKVSNQTVFEGGTRDISDVCRNDASCASLTGCQSVQGGEACSFRFAVFLREEAAQKHAELTKNLSLDETGQYLSEKLYLFVDDKEVDSLLIGSSLRGQVTTEISIQGSGTGATREEAIENARAEMNRLQTILITGSLPYKLEIEKLDTISPTLGGEFKKNIIFLGLIVFAIVSLVLFFRYRKIKITLAVILTMFSELFITLGIAALIKWNLDAPSIAGIIAGMGTGINDQIVIIDESVSNITISLKERIKRAFFIIVGAFFTIFAAMLPLLLAGAGMLRGFALTTLIGVTVGILITRPAFADIIKKMVS